MNKKLLATVLGITIIVLSLADIYGLWLLRGHGGLSRLVEVESLDGIETSFNLMGPSPFKEHFPGEDHLLLLRQVMNFVEKTGPEPSYEPLEMIAHVQQGGGLICSGMASLYFHALHLNDIRARIVILARNMFDIYDAHATVEVFQDGRWIIYDPTFHVSFKRKERLLGGQEIMQALHDGSFDKIQPVFYGEVNYPARLETYYMHWLPLFNNVFVYDLPHSDLLAKLPPFRYWLGPVWYYEPMENSGYEHVAFHDSLYTLYVAVLPLFLITLFVLLIITVYLLWREKHISRSPTRAST